MKAKIGPRIDSFTRKVAKGVVFFRVIAIDSRNCMNYKRKYIFERDEYACRYCGGEAEVVDHVIPWSFRHDDSEENLVASCTLCNLFVSNKFFRSFNKKREYIIDRRFGKSRNKPLTIWLFSEICELGRGLRAKVEPRVIIADTDEQAESILKRLTAGGYNVRINAPERR